MATPETSPAPESPDVVVLYDRLGRKRSPATLPGYHAGRPPRNRGEKYPPDPPNVGEIVRLLAACRPPGTVSMRDYLAHERLRALIVLLFASGMRVGEALSLVESDLDETASSIFIRKGKGGKPRTIGVAEWAWAEVRPWLDLRRGLRPGPIFCVVAGLTEGQRWDQTQVRKSLRELRLRADVRRRCPAHSLRHAFSLEWVRRGGRIELLSRQLGHSSLDVTMEYLRSIPQTEVIDAVRSWAMPMVPAFGATPAHERRHEAIAA